MKTKNLLITVAISSLILLQFACDKREDIFAVNNEAPKLEINALNTPGTLIKDFTSETMVLDSFNFNIYEYLINFKLEDESEKVQLEYLVDNDATIELVEETRTEEDNKYLIEGVIKVTFLHLGKHTIDIVATDPYDLSKRISIDLNVYLSNIQPSLRITTVNNFGSNNPTLMGVDITDTFSYSQGDIIIDYEIVDDNVNYNLNYSTTGGGSIVEDLGQKTVFNQTYSVLVTGQLRLTPGGIGLHDVEITVTDDILQSKTLHAYIYITDIAPTITVNPGLNTAANVTNYVSSFSNEKFIREAGIYKIQYRVIDDNTNPNITFNINNGGSVTDDIPNKTIVTNNGITTVNGILEVQTTIAATHTINVNVADANGTTTSSNSVIFSNNVMPSMGTVSIVKFVNNINLNWGSSSGDTWFGDAITNHDVELYKNGNLVYTSSTVTTSLSVNASAYGNGNYYARVRAYDTYGGVSTWKVSNTIFF